MSRNANCQSGEFERVRHGKMLFLLKNRRKSSSLYARIKSRHAALGHSREHFASLTKPFAKRLRPLFRTPARGTHG
jgi:hypothetical protein